MSTVYPKHLVAHAIHAPVNDPVIFDSTIQTAELIRGQLKVVFDAPWPPGAAGSPLPRRPLLRRERISRL